LNPEIQSGPNVPWENIVRFVRQLSHDLRNDLNAAELQTAYIAELTGDAELKEEIKRLRKMISKLAVTLQELSTALSQAKPVAIPYRITDFVEDSRAKLEKDFLAASETVKWEIQTGDSMFAVDPQLLQQVWFEIFHNAFEHERGTGSILATAEIDNDRFVFRLHEPKKGFELSTEKWGREPLGKVRHGHYGLGLHRARIILEAHGGELRAEYDAGASQLITTITLPVSRAQK
jgi:K+-sensing histidine kinase KdpD